MATILVQMSDKPWTMQAIHLASALARNNDSRIVLLRLMQVTHPGYLGTDFGYEQLSSQQYTDIKEYYATAEDYGIDLSVQMMQCLSTLEAVVEAADCLNADVVFARVPDSRIPYWYSVRRWMLKRRLAAARRQIFTLDIPATPGIPGAAFEQAPAITIRAACSSAGSKVATKPVASK